MEGKWRNYVATPRQLSPCRLLALRSPGEIIWPYKDLGGNMPFLVSTSVARGDEPITSASAFRGRLNSSMCE